MKINGNKIEHQIGCLSTIIFRKSVQKVVVFNELWLQTSKGRRPWGSLNKVCLFIYRHQNRFLPYHSITASTVSTSYRYHFCSLGYSWARSIGRWFDREDFYVETWFHVHGQLLWKGNEIFRFNDNHKRNKSHTDKLCNQMGWKVHR